MEEYFLNLRSSLQEILAIKNNSKEMKEILINKRKKALMSFVLVKKINRSVKYDVRDGREKLYHEKKIVDSNRLQLQNLLYEVNHLKREIKSCTQFKSQDEDIDLLTEEEYLQELDPKDNKITDKHLIYLQYELLLRKKLSNYCQTLKHSKKEILTNITHSVDRLASLEPSLQLLQRSAKSLQTAFHSPIYIMWNMSKLVNSLSPPLYLIYMNIFAYKMSSDSDFDINILQTQDDMEIEEVDVEEKPISQELVEFHSHSRNEILKPHKLVIQYVIKKDDNSLEIQLRYFPCLKIVTASSNLNITTNDVISSSIVKQNFLSLLFAKDTGNDIPMTYARYELNKSNIKPEEFIKYLNNKNLGKPYRWAQKICCVNASKDADYNMTKDKLIRIIPHVLKSIQSLFSIRLDLITEIRALVNKNMDLYFQDFNINLPKPSCSLVQWSAVQNDENIPNFDDNNGDNLYYRAVIVRGSAKMECLITITRQYPNSPPFWNLSVHWNGILNATNNAAIKMMEYWTNSVKAKDCADSSTIIANQLFRTMLSFDIFLETEGPFHSPNEYTKEKNFMKSFTKRIRARPFKLIKNENIFKQ